MARGKRSSCSGFPRVVPRNARSVFGESGASERQEKLLSGVVVAAATRCSTSLAELIALARTGDRVALGRLVNAARGELLRAATRELPGRLTRKVGASDIVQETTVEVHRGIRGFSGTTEAELFAWMRRILRNNIADAVRYYQGTVKRQVNRELRLDDSRAGFVRDGLPGKEEPPDESLMRLEDAARVSGVIKIMSPRYREVLHLRYWEQCSFVEIGLRLNRSPDAVRKLWGRAVKEFQTLLAREQESCKDV